MGYGSVILKITVLRGSTDFWRSKKLFWDTLAVHSTNIVMVICFCLNCVCFNFDIPVAADTLGGLHSVAVEQVKKLGSSLARHQGQEEEEEPATDREHLFVSPKQRTGKQQKEKVKKKEEPKSELQKKIERDLLAQISGTATTNKTIDEIVMDNLNRGEDVQAQLAKAAAP